MTLVCVGEGRGAHVALEGGVCAYVVVLGGDGLVSVLALEVPGGAVVSVVCGGRGSLSCEL